MPRTPAQRQELADAKANIARALTEAGVPSAFWETMAVLLSRATRLFGPPRAGEWTADYFNRVAWMAPRPKAAGSGQIALPRTDRPLHAPEWRPRQHMRAAEIDALPRLIPAAGAGNNPGLGGQEGMG